METPREQLAAAKAKSVDGMPDDQVVYVLARDLRGVGISVDSDCPDERPVKVTAGQLRGAHQSAITERQGAETDMSAPAPTIFVGPDDDDE
jgi:hypothetical protein